MSKKNINNLSLNMVKAYEYAIHGRQKSNGQYT